MALPGGAVIINDCYNANPLSMRAALDDLATQEPAGGAGSRSSETCSSSGTGEAEAHREIGAHAARAGVDVLVTVGPRAAAMARRFGGEAHARRRRPRRPPPLTAGLVRPGDLVLVKASRGIGLEAVAEALAPSADRPPMGEVLIAGTASLLICVFLSPKFIEFLRAREFGQHIREDGPQEHHAKAGTPTMGGIIIFTAIAVPFLLLTRPATGGRSASSAWRSRARCSASPTTTRSSSGGARSGCAGGRS